MNVLFIAFFPLWILFWSPTTNSFKVKSGDQKMISGFNELSVGQTELEHPNFYYKLDEIPKDLKENNVAEKDNNINSHSASENESKKTLNKKETSSIIESGKEKTPKIHETIKTTSFSTESSILTKKITRMTTPRTKKIPSAANITLPKVIKNTTASVKADNKEITKPKAQPFISTNITKAEGAYTKKTGPNIKLILKASTRKVKETNTKPSARVDIMEGIASDFMPDSDSNIYADFIPEPISDGDPEFMPDPSRSTQLTSSFVLLMGILCAIMNVLFDF